VVNKADLETRLFGRQAGRICAGAKTPQRAAIKLDRIASIKAHAMARTLLLYHSGYGHTRRIAERIRDRLSARGEEVVVSALGEQSSEPSDYDRIVLGASIRNGKHNPAVTDFIHRHQALLTERQAAFFSVNLVARKPGKDTPEGNPYVRKFLERITWKPALVGVFAGDLDYPKYGAFDRTMIRLIMWMTGGPTDPTTREVYTDWPAVDRFADALAGFERNPRG